MVDQIPSMKQLIRHLQQVPYLASKNLYKVLTHFLDMPEAEFKQFCHSLEVAKASITRCSSCFVFQEKNAYCLICADPKRDKTIICVVETWQDMLSVERTQGFVGLYHVLGGVISPLDGVTPADLTINQLVQRINDTTKEVILALNQTPESEVTAAYIGKKMAGMSCVVTSLAKGVPVGASLEYTDRLTMIKALHGRRPL